MNIFKHIQFLVLVLFPMALSGAQVQQRETILDRIEHTEPDLKEVLALPPLCDQSPGLTKTYITLRDGAKLYCEQEGQGAPLVLLAGGPGNSHHAFHPHFSAIANFARVIYFDFRGCGKSDYTGVAGYSVDQAVDDLEDLRKTLGIEKWFVLGHSNGGFIAQYYAKKYASHVAGLILVCAGFDEIVEKEKLKDDFSDQKKYISAQELHRIEYLTKTTFKNPAPYEARYKERLARLVYNRLLNGDWRRQSFYCPTNEEMVRTALYGYVCDFGFYPAAMCISQRNVDISSFDGSIPTLIVEGKYDLTWNPEKKPAILQSIHPRAKLVMFEKSAHSPFADEPEKFTNELKDFMRISG